MATALTQTEVSGDRVAVRHLSVGFDSHPLPLFAVRHAAGLAMGIAEKAAPLKITRECPTP
jgi:hypothetical protein